MKYYIIAGEPSGDLHGSNLMLHLKQLDKNAEFRFWGGDLMQKEGGTMVKHYRETAIMGITEVIKNIFKIFSFIRLCKNDIMQYSPDAVILIDYPGFNMRIAKFAHKAGFTTHYYISPKVWAWNTKRAYKIKKYVSELYTILPFETEFFKQFGVNPNYVGNPLCDAISSYSFEENFKAKHKINKPIIALLPGSRMSELKFILNSMLDMVKYYPDYQFVLAGANHISDSIYTDFIDDKNVILLKNQTYDILTNANAALVCSGTATLETALLNCPQVVCYRFSKLSFFIGKLVVKVPYISLVNLIMKKRLVPELLQDDLNDKKIKYELDKILSEDGAKQQKIGYAALKIKVGEAGASKRVATLIYEKTHQLKN